MPRLHPARSRGNNSGLHPNRPARHPPGFFMRPRLAGGGNELHFLVKAALPCVGMGNLCEGHLGRR